jgi:hypothetical protein
MRSRQLLQPRSRPWGVKVSDWTEEKVVVVSSSSSSTNHSSTAASVGGSSKKGNGFSNSLSVLSNRDNSTNETEEESKVTCVVGECCRLCGEKFDTVFNEKKEEWVCR